MKTRNTLSNNPVKYWSNIRLNFCRQLLIILLFSGLLTVAQAGQTEGISSTDLEQVVQRALLEFNVPGMAIGIVQADKVLLEKGYGVRELGKKGAVNPATLFKIASNSKAFTTAALASLVDAGKLKWDGLVIDTIPELRMQEPWVTANLSVIDLLTHRSGLKPYVGDLMLWPEPNDYSINDIIYALRYFDLSGGFRSKYAYDNQLYIVAGELIPRITGKSWGEYVEQKLFRPAGMKRCFSTKIPSQQMHNLAVPHGVIEGKLTVIERGRIPATPPVSAAAGGIICSLEDMLIWARTQLNQGTAPNGHRLFSPEQSRQLWQARTLRSVSEQDRELHNTHFKAYGLGWRLADAHGYKKVSHTGTLAGFRSYVALIPELELGVVLLSNGAGGAARAAVMNTIVESFMPINQRDWVQFYADKIAESQALAAAGPKPGRASKGSAAVHPPGPVASQRPDLSLYAGHYIDPWFGAVEINYKQGQLQFVAEKSPKLSGPMQYHDGDRFMLRWTDRSLNADTWVMFKRGINDDIVGMSLLQESDDGDYDFTDLNFSRQQPASSQ